MREQIKVYVEKLSPDVILPTYANVNDAAMDIRSAVNIKVAPQETVIVHTGLKFAIPEGYEIQVRPRSGISLNTPLRVANSPGTIDTGYRGELGIIISNTSIETHITDTYTLEQKGNIDGIYKINKGDRICQILLQRVPEIMWEEVTSVKDIGLDRESGLGGTGIK